MSQSYITALIILGFIALSLLIIALIYTIIAARRKNILMKKTDYLIEDLTYKSEMLNSTVETVSKVANYVDMFEVVARKNIKSSAKLLARNKDDIYKILDRMKKIAMGETEINKKSSSKKKEGK